MYAGLFAMTLVLLARSNWAMVVYRLLTDGVLTLVWIASAWGWGTILLRRLPIDANSVLRVVSEIAMGLGLISLLTPRGSDYSGFLEWPRHFVDASPGRGRWCVLSLTSRNFQIEGAIFARSDPLVLLTSPLLAVAVFAALVPPGFLWGDEPNGYDAHRISLADSAGVV